MDRAALAKSLADHLGDLPVTDALHECVALAAESVTHYTRSADVPPATLSRAVVLVAAEHWHTREAPGGVRAVMDSEGGVTPIRVGRDPMAAARPLLRPYVGLAFA